MKSVMKIQPKISGLLSFGDYISCFDKDSARSDDTMQALSAQMDLCFKAVKEEYPNASVTEWINPIYHQETNNATGKTVYTAGWRFTIKTT